MKRTFIVLIFLVLGASIANAHIAGQFFEKEVGGYLVDVDYNTLPIQAGEPVRFDFNIWTEDRTESPEFTDAWVRIAPQNSFGIVFASDLHKPDFGLTGVTYTFPKGGAYDLTVRFQKNGDQIVDEVSFPVTVEASQETSTPTSRVRDSIMGIIIGAVAGAAFVFFIKE